MTQTAHRAPWQRDREPDAPQLVHRSWCRCDVCTPPTASLSHDARHIAALCAAGVAIGLLLVLALDRLTGGPGLGVMVGW